MKLASSSGDWQLILPTGHYETAKYGAIEFSRDYCEQIVQHWRARVLGNREPFVDVDHDKGEAQGWIADLEARDDGLWARITWTEPGKDKVEKGLYRYFSADLAKVQALDGNTYFPVLVGLALTNTPVMNNLPDVKLSAKDTPVTPAAKPAQAGGLTKGVKGTTIPSPAHGDRNKNLSEVKMDFEKFLEQLKGMVGEDGAGLTPQQKDAIIDILVEGYVDHEMEGAASESDGVAMKARLGKRLDFAKKLAKACGESEAKDKGAEDREPAAAGKVEDEAGKPPKEHKSAQTPQPTRMSEKGFEILMSEVKELREENARIQAAMKTSKKKDVLELALSEGRIQPKDRAKWEAHYDAAPEQVERILSDMPANPLFATKGTAQAASSLQMSEEDARQARDLGKRMGWSDDEVEQFIKKGSIDAKPAAAK